MREKRSEVLPKMKIDLLSVSSTVVIEHCSMQSVKLYQDRVFFTVVPYKSLNIVYFMEVYIFFFQIRVTSKCT